MYKKRTYNRDVFIIWVIAGTTFLPSTTFFNILKLAIAAFIFFLKCRKINKVFLIWVGNIVVATLAVIIVEHGIISTNIFHEFTRVVFYALVVEICMCIEVELKTLYKIAIIVLGIHFAIQTTQYFRMNIFDSFIENYYLSGNADNIHYIQSKSNDYAFRSGSIFINPNVYACYPSLCAGVFLQQYSKKRTWFPLIMLLIGFISIVLTGSRMGLVTYIFIIVLCNRKKIKFNTKITKVKILVFISLLLLVLNRGYIADFISTSRAFDLGEAYDGSLFTKLSGIISYFKISSPLYWITGSLGSPRCTFAIDMEYGYVFAWYGVIGVYWFVRLLKQIYNRHKNDYPNISRTTVLTILLTDIAASTVLNMSVFPFICALGLTGVKKEGNYEQN